MIFLNAIAVYLVLGASLLTAIESLRFFPKAQIWIFEHPMPTISLRGRIQTILFWPAPLFFLLVIIIGQATK